jgi:MFS family permease
MGDNGGAAVRLTARIGPDVALLRRSREFRLLYGGQMSSFADSMISFVAMPYQAYQLTRSSLVVGLLSFAELAPLVATALLGGALADAVDRRRLIRGSQCLLCGCGAALALNASAWHQLWLLFLLAAASAGLYGLQRPSLEALVPVLVRRDELPAAAALTGLLGNAASLAGPLLGGFLIKLGGLPVAYTAGSAACVIALAAFTRMRATPPPPDAARPSLRGVADGLRYASSRPELLGTYLIDILAMLFGAPYALFPAIADRLGGPAVLGLLYAAPGAGGPIVSMTSGWTSHVHRHGRAIAAAVGGWGAGIAAFGFATSLWWDPGGRRRGPGPRRGDPGGPRRHRRHRRPPGRAGRDDRRHLGSAEAVDLPDRGDRRHLRGHPAGPGGGQGGRRHHRGDPVHRPVPARLRARRGDQGGLRRHLRDQGELPADAGRPGRDLARARQVRAADQLRVRSVHAGDRGAGRA